MLNYLCLYSFFSKNDILFKRLCFFIAVSKQLHHLFLTASISKHIKMAFNYETENFIVHHRSVCVTEASLFFPHGRMFSNIICKEMNRI